MRIPRIFQDTPLTGQIELALNENAANHVARVLRLKPGAPITLFNGEGGEYLSLIKEVDKRRVVVEVGAFTDTDTESPIHITLAQGISRGERMDYTIQKAVELGINGIVPLITERCMVDLKGERLQKRLAHWQGIIIGACEQSGRNVIPQLMPSMTFKEWLVQPDSGTKLLLDHRASHGIQGLQRVGNFTLLIGPEGGLAPWEQEAALESGYKGIRLGPRVLRTETAALVALSALQSHFGDLG